MTVSTRDPCLRSLAVERRNLAVLVSRISSYLGGIQRIYGRAQIPEWLYIYSWPWKYVTPTS
jgi:hypothetical protein